MSRAQRHTATVAESHGDRAMVTVTVTVVNSKLELLPIYQSRCHIMPVAVVHHASASGDSEATTRLASDPETALARDLPCTSKPVPVGSRLAP